jgi:hypothetical protein
MKEMKLTGSRCQCIACDEYFNSTFAFDKHRIGEHGKTRRCMTIDEMLAKGMEKNEALFWVSSANTFKREKTA